MIKEVFIQNLNEAYLCVQQEWQEAKQGNNSRDEKVLLVIMDELSNMKNILDCHVFLPYYPKHIADEWSYQDELGIRLMKLATDYEKLKV